MPESSIELLDCARAARQRGDIQEAILLLERCRAITPGDSTALNMLGLVLSSAGRATDAIQTFEAAIAIDPDSALLRLNLADALHAVDSTANALAAIDAALERDPYLVPALIRKGRWLENVNQLDDALRTYRALLKILSDDGTLLPPAYAAAVQDARARVRADGEARLRRLDATLAEHGIDERHAGNRAHAYLEQLCGLRTIFLQQPTGPHFPFLPAIEYFDEALFPWFAELEAASPIIRAEFLARWHEDRTGFDPYVNFTLATPVNQWSELNRSPSWSALFLWRDGIPHEENIRRCPGTAAAIDAMPLLDVPGKSPTVMFSVLAPRTRIPPHTGVTNTRATVHLPLVVPSGCRFRVGGETRELIEGRAWAFDDSIEHEAFNDSDTPRAVLIIDAWNPFLTKDERAIVRLAAPEMRL